jgi:hypothetical protein
MLDDMTEIFAPERPVRDRLHGAYQRIARMSDEEFDVIRIVVREAMISSSRLQKLFARFTSGHVPLLLSTLQAGILDGTLSPTVPLPALVAALASTVIFPQLARRRLGAELPMLAPVLPGPEALADALFEIVMHGAAARPTP